jgi:hypothetical protein
MKNTILSPKIVIAPGPQGDESQSSMGTMPKDPLWVQHLGDVFQLILGVK